MKIQPRRSAKFLYTAIALAVVIIGSLIYFVGVKPRLSPSSGNTEINSPATPEQKEAGNTIKEDSIEEGSATKPGTSNTDQTPTPTDQESGKTKIELSITAANQSGGVLQIRSLLNAIVNSGVCTLSLTGPSDQVITKTAEVQALSSTSTCKGFDIPISELTTGEWRISLHFENTTSIADTTKTITVE